VDPLFGRPLASAATVSLRYMVPTADGGAVLGGVAELDAGDQPWVGRMGPTGYLMWRVAGVPPLIADGQVAGLTLAANGDIVVALHDFDGGVRSLRLVRLNPDGELVWDRDLGGQERKTQGLRARPGGGFVLLVDLEIARPDGTQLILQFVDEDGLNPAEVRIAGPQDAILEGFHALPDGNFLLTGGYSSGQTSPGFVQVVDSTGAEVWLDVLDPQDGHQIVVELAALVDGGAFLAVGRDFQQANEQEFTFVRRYAAEGAIEGTALLGGDIKPVSAAATPRGDLFLLSESFEVHRLSQQGAVGAIFSYTPDRPRLGGALALTADGRGILFGGAVLQNEGGIVPYVGRADAWGQASCHGSGLCVSTAADACDDGETCTADRCVPTTGLCEADDYADGSPCGAALTCGGGVCQ
jgi:hypothetical protein